MKNLISILAVSLLVGACSKSSSGGGGAPPAQGTLFEQSTAGAWISECQHDQAQNIFFRDSVTLNKGGTGTSTGLVFATADCTGQEVRREQTLNFNYSVDSTDANGVSQINLTFPGKPAFKASVKVVGNKMAITSPAGTVQFEKAGAAPGGGNGAGAGTAMAEFDRLAIGTWMTTACTPANGQSVVVIVTIAGQGNGSVIRNVYQNTTCAGEPQGSNPQNFTYTVDSFANGTGQIKVNNQTATTISIQNNTMTLQSAGGPVTYTKVR